jgi:hypothetical protein
MRVAAENSGVTWSPQDARGSVHSGGNLQPVVMREEVERGLKRPAEQVRSYAASASRSVRMSAEEEEETREKRRWEEARRRCASVPAAAMSRMDFVPPGWLAAASSTAFSATATGSRTTATTADVWSGLRQPTTPVRQVPTVST